jgi:hypothetical protein
VLVLQTLLLAISTLIALSVAVYARRDRHEETEERWLRELSRALEHAAAMVVELADASHQIELKRLAQYGKRNPLFKHVVLPEEIRPVSMTVARLKLRAALAAVPNSDVHLPKSWALLDLESDKVEGVPASDALSEIEAELSEIARTRVDHLARRNKTIPRRLWRWLRMVVTQKTPRNT